MSIIDSFYLMYQDGLMTQSRAQWLATKQIESLRYGNDDAGYFWISDVNANVVMHPIKQK